MEKINVNLYGGRGIFGGKEKPLEADVIFCNKADKCSLYKENKCLNCRSMSLHAPRCKEGRVETVKGYTSRAAKYYEFYNKYKSDEKYNKLNFPYNSFVWKIDEELYFKLSFVRVRQPKEDEKYLANKWGYIVESNYFGPSCYSVNINKININLLASILSYVPSTLMGHTNEDYQKKVVPEIVLGLKNVAPKIYKQLLFKYPQYDVSPNYIGKYALMKTLVDGAEIVDCHGNKAIKKGEFLYCQNFTRGFVPFDGVSAECKIKIPDNKFYKVTSNSQCDENTIFE